MIALIPLAAAQQPARLLNESDLQECLDAPACENVFTTLLSESLLEMGFLFQHDGLGGSAIAGKGNSFVIELSAHSQALGPKNIVMENLRLPPVVPRLEVGYQVGSFTFDDPYPQFAVSAYFFPPVKLDDYDVFAIGGTGSFAVPLGTHFFWAGAELDASYGHVNGPFVGDGDVIDDIQLVGDLVDVQTPPCDASATGCRDRYRTFAAIPRIGVSFEPLPPIFGYGKAGVGWVVGDVDVAYDDSRWRMTGLQPQFSYGGGVRLGDRVQITFGGVTALKGAAVSSTDKRTMTRLIGSFSVRTGDPRYWYDDAPPDEPPRPGPDVPASAPTDPDEPDAPPDP